MKTNYRRIISTVLIAVMLLAIMPMIRINADDIDRSGWLWPVKTSTTMSRAYYSEHTALDILPGSESETAIYASKAGKVTRLYLGCKNWSGYSSHPCSSATCSPNDGFGWIDGKSYCNHGFGVGIVLDHGDGYASAYAHMDYVVVSYGQTVTKGQLLGYMGSRGASTGKHLHFEIRKNYSASKEFWNCTSVNNNPVGEYLIQNASLWNKVDRIEYSRDYSEIPVNPISFTSVTEAYGYKAYVKETDAMIMHKISMNSGFSINSLQKVGIELMNSNEVVIASKEETPSHDYDYVYAWYYVNSELGVTLTPGTQYMYRFFGVYNGTKFYGETLSFTTLAQQISHNYTAVITPPTCTEQGYTTYTCSDCGDSYISDYTEATMHTVVTDAAVAATCTESGKTAGSHCSVCGVVLTAQTTVPAKGHTYAAVVTPPTATTRGYTTYTCSVCGDSYVSDYTDPIEPDPNATTVTVAKISGAPGQTVSVPVTLSKNEGLWGVSLTVKYNKGLLTLVGVTNGNVFSDAEWTPGTLTGSNYILSYEASGFDDITNNGTLATLEFRISDDAPVGSVVTVTVEYESGNVIRANFDEVPLNIEAGEVKVTNVLYGDVNGDGLVNKKDSLALKKYLADTSYAIDLAAADVYYDGVVNKKDSLRLKQYLAGWDVALGG